MQARSCERVVSLDAGLVTSNARLLAAALSNDPAYCYLFPELATRTAGLEDFFTRNQRTHLPHRCTYVALSEHGSRSAPSRCARRAAFASPCSP